MPQSLRAAVRIAAVLALATTGGLVVNAVARAADDAPTVVGERWLDDRQVDLTVRSPANGKDLPVRLLVPPGWSRTATRTWPVLYLLHGARDDYTSWTRETDIEALSATSGALVVMPEGGRDGYYSDWWNHGRAGGPMWETFHVRELWQVLRDGYRAGEERSVAGISSGGLGAVLYAARNPGMFRYAAAYSPPVAVFNVTVQAIITAILLDESGDALALWGSSIFQRDIWRAHDPVSLAANLRGTGLYLSCGTTGLPGDLDPPGANPIGTFSEPLVAATVAQLALRLAVLGIPATVNLYGAGTHSWPYWQRELHTSWPMLMASLGID